MADEKRRLFGIQFHPEVTHTTHGQQVLANFLLRVCGCKGDWHPSDHVREVEAAIRRQAGERRVLFFLSGGVDSTVAYTLAVRALGPERVHAIFVDTGFMRQDETQEIAAAFEQLNLGRLEVIDARQRFFQALRGVIDPEEKRQIIGRLFVEIQDGILAGRRYRRGDWMLGQGTIYPDTIESGGTKNAARIKTHHNRVDRIQQMIAEKRVLEPLAKFVKEAGVRLVLVMTAAGQVLAQHGFARAVDVMSAAALGAAIIASTEEIARQLRQPPFAGLNHQGQRHGIFLAGVTTARGRLVTLVVYDLDVSSVGLVQLFFEQLAADLQAASPKESVTKQVLAADFERQLTESLNTLFGR
jgi:GMP synthase (glutamine-hydrolysing)